MIELPRWNLPDWSVSAPIAHLHHTMGIREVPWMGPLEFVRTIETTTVTQEPDPVEKRFLDKLAGSGIELEAQMHGYEKDAPLTLQGRRILAYKYRQGLETGSRGGVNLQRRTSSYKFHLFYCRTFEAARSLHGYHAARRDDGRLEVVPLQNRKELPPALVQMELCGNCRKLVGPQHSHPLSFTEFVKLEDPHSPRLYPVDRIESVEMAYTPKREELHQAYGEAVGWRCMSCAVDCSDHRDLLDVYDVRSNNSELKGVRVLCVACRASEPGQGSVWTERATDIERARDLRRASRFGTAARQGGEG